MLVCINPAFVIFEQTKAARSVSVPLLPTVAYCECNTKCQKFGETRNCQRKYNRVYSLNLLKTYLKQTKLINYINFLLHNGVHSLSHTDFSYQPAKCSFIGSADVTDILGDRLRRLCSTFFSSVLSSAHLLMQRQANLLSYEKGVNPTNNKTLSNATSASFWGSHRELLP